MGFDSNGTYTRWEGPDTWQKDAAAGTRIASDRHDQHDADIGNALSACLNRNGYGAALANISMGGHKITNLLDGVALTDAATMNQVKNLLGWDTSKYIKGTNANGRLNFTGDTGANGITWTGADLSWIARLADPNETSHRLVMNNTNTPSSASSTNDAFIIDEAGNINTSSGQLTWNLSWTGVWRAIQPGYGGLLRISGGDFSLQSNDVASITNPYVSVTLREYFQANNTAGSTTLALKASASGKYNAIFGMVGATPTRRWVMYFGDGTAESGGLTGRGGSNFLLNAYDNSGSAGINALTINRSTGLATLNGDVKVTGILTTDTYLKSTADTLVLQAPNTGQIIMLPDDTNQASQFTISNNGTVSLCNADPSPTGGFYAGAGLRSKLGQSGAYQATWINFNWTGSAFDAYSGTGVIHLQTIACDYRIKKDVEPLPSLWDRVKALKPVSYTQAAFDIWTEDDTVRWGFLAHEVGDDLSPAAVIGEKDGPGAQGLNLITVIAGLTKALQEAMARIEALEAAP